MENSTERLIWCILLKRKRPVTEGSGQVAARIKEPLFSTPDLANRDNLLLLEGAGILKGEWRGETVLKNQFGEIHSM